MSDPEKTNESSDGAIYAAVSRRNAMREVLDFLNSIEGHGYGGMATFEVARMNIRFELGLIPEIVDTQIGMDWKLPDRDCPNCRGDGSIGIMACLHCGATGVDPVQIVSKD